MKSQDITKLKIWPALKAAGFTLLTQKTGPNYRHTMKVARFGHLSIMPTCFDDGGAPHFWRVWNGSNRFADCTSRQLADTLKDVLSHATNPELKTALLTVLAPNGLPIGTTVYDTATNERLTKLKQYTEWGRDKIPQFRFPDEWIKTYPRFTALQIP